ncbi:MAG TPA: GAF domain-containing protein [Frankiaceae bacterium]|nr:GAF domain-containing protein [Frankiaceae bacterium]
MQVADGTLHLGAEPDAVQRARRWVAEALEGTPYAELIPDAELVVSELVTNSLLHGSPPVTVRVDVDDVVRIEVSDGTRIAPVRGFARADAMTGRGLSLVAALARDWGVTPHGDGKVVWCELVVGGAPGDADADTDVDALLAAWGDDLDDGGPERHTISLGDVPTDLLLAAKAHVDNLVREFTLAAHGADAGTTAAIPSQLAELIEAVVTRFAEARQAIKRQAIDAATRGVDRTTLTLTLPVEAADAGEAYVAALDEIDTYARAARLLTLETPPQHRVFRRWYVESLVTQLRAVASGETPRPPETFERRLLEEVNVVTVARRAAERAARLQNVTAALAATTSVGDVGGVVLSEAVDALGASGGVLVVADEERLGVRATVGYSEGVVERIRAESTDEQLPAAIALRTGEEVWLESREERDERFPGLAGLEPGTVSMCAVPLKAGAEILGALRFSFDGPHLFDGDERLFVRTLAAQTAQAMERAQALAEARAANDKLSFLADASAALAQSLDYRETLAGVTRLAVPRLADWCVIHVAEEGAITALAVAHVDPEKVAMAESFQHRYPVDPEGSDGVARVLRTGDSELYHHITDEMLVGAARDDEHLALMRDLGFVSALLVPLSARGRVFGTLSMVYAESGRTYDEADLAIAVDLAHRAALAIDNADLYRRLAAQD